MIRTGVAQIQRDADGTFLTVSGGITLLMQLRACLSHEPADLLRQVFKPGWSQRCIDMTLATTGLAGLSHAIGRQHSRQGMQQNGRETEFVSQAAGVLPGRAAISHEHAAADVLATVQGHPTDGRSHRLDRQLQG